MDTASRAGKVNYFVDTNRVQFVYDNICKYIFASREKFHLTQILGIEIPFYRCLFSHGVYICWYKMKTYQQDKEQSNITNTVITLFMMSNCISPRLQLGIVLSATISAEKNYVRSSPSLLIFILQGFMFYLCYLYLYTYTCVQQDFHIR